MKKLKRQTKLKYKKSEIFLSEALDILIFDCDMFRGEAFNYLHQG